MQDTAVSTPARTSGRQRDPSLDAPILAAATDLLAEVGYDALSVEAVARRAGIAKTTLYRRWRTKPELVVASIRWQHEQDAPPLDRDTGSLRGDLIAEVERLAHDIRTETVAQMAGLFLAMRREPDLADAFATQLIQPKRDALHASLDRAIARGEITSAARGLSLFEQIIPSMVLGRRFALDLPVDRAFAAELVDTVVLPALHATAPRTPPASPTRRRTGKERS